MIMTWPLLGHRDDFSFPLQANGGSARHLIATGRRKVTCTEPVRRAAYKTVILLNKFGQAEKGQTLASAAGHPVGGRRYLVRRCGQTSRRTRWGRKGAYHEGGELPDIEQGPGIRSRRSSVCDGELRRYP